MPNLGGKVCLVTGASRGIGRGIALQLITNGATCYITGRDLSKLEAVKNEAKERGAGGHCIPVQCDHSKDDDIKELFNKISSEQNGTLDLLVNNAYSAVEFVFGNNRTYFWDQPIESWDTVNRVGLRNHYLCTVYASRLMVPKRKGLIINLSSAGAVMPFLTPLYGIGKAAKDRMVNDCALELMQYNIAFISLWPGPVKTEHVVGEAGMNLRERDFMVSHGESTEFSGIAISHLLQEANIMNRTGKVVMVTDVAAQYGFADVDGYSPLSMRSLQLLLLFTPLSWLSSFTPQWFKIPFWMYKILAPMGAVPEEKNKSKYE